MKNINKCPNCNSIQHKLYMQCVDHTVSKNTFSIVSCNQCDLKFTNPRPKDEDLHKYYESDEYISHTNDTKGWFNILYQLARKLNIKSKIKVIGNTKGSILEIGSGTGELLAACKKIGWDTTGVEPSLKARESANNKLNIDLKQSLADTKLENKSKDIIMMWHVLEHIPSLNETLTQIKNILKDDGKLIIAVPNHKSYDAKKYQNNWAAYDLPRHLLHFDRATMKNTLNNIGFEIVQTRPMLIDPIYISMLSEKIKTGKRNPTKSIYIGLISNLKAFFGTKEYSSIIYIAKKRF